MKPTVQLVTSGMGTVGLKKNLTNLSRMAAYVGIPEKNAQRAHGGPITNAQLAFIHTRGVRALSMRREVGASMKGGMTFEAATGLYLHSHGSPLYAIPPRPIIEPAIEANKQPIQEELKLSAKATLDDQKPEAVRHLKLAGQLGENFARAWFTDPRNHWAPNAPSTIRQKGSSRPLIRFSELRKAITSLTVTS